MVEGRAGCLNMRNNVTCPRGCVTYLDLPLHSQCVNTLLPVVWTAFLVEEMNAVRGDWCWAQQAGTLNCNQRHTCFTWLPVHFYPFNPLNCPLSFSSYFIKVREKPQSSIAIKWHKPVGSWAPWCQGFSTIEVKIGNDLEMELFYPKQLQGASKE